MFLLQGHFHAENKTINRELISKNDRNGYKKGSSKASPRYFIALILSHKIRQMLAKFSGVEV